MIRIAMAVALGLGVAAVAARAEPPAPQAYALKGQGTILEHKLTVTIVRDGTRERIERTIGPHTSASLYDFAAHRVYWIGFSGPGSCSFGRYLSARAPVDQDPVTGTADHLPKIAEGRTRKAAGSGTVGKVPARIEALVGGRKPAGEDGLLWPTRVWLSEPEGYLVKLETDGPGGRPKTLFEVTELTFGKPSGALLEPPSPCTETNAEMDDTGVMRAHGATSVAASVGGSADLGAAAPGSRAGATEDRGSRPGAAGALASIAGMSLSAVEQPDGGKCGRKLKLTGTISVDGPATVKYSFRSNVGGVRFGKGENGTVTVDAAGDATLVTEATLQRPQKGTMRLQAFVQGAKGRNGPLQATPPVPFEVSCEAR